ncbi:MAG TPA: PEP/pyruvate-binding domain-containing protein, partial [Candidatus Brocadiia bacterium]|nr:PEP/pyruvate-binding domain-containing protein [Candidatus Brocadiia bacterium]
EAHAPEIDDTLAEADSYFLKSSVASDYVDSNHLEECHSLKYLEGDAIEEARRRLYPRFMRGRFNDEVLQKLHAILDETDGAPLILRSSSYLEDGVGCSFTGKYESVFISNRGSREERLEEFTNGIRRVLFSIYSSHALQYRRDKKLIDYNERMSVLIQKVVGSAYGKYFFPAAGIVGFSKNPYCWSSRIRPEDGMLRMVMGLGTRAVDRTGDDYPRMVSLTEPALRPEITTAEKIRYSQRTVDVLNLETRALESVYFVDLINYILAQGLSLPLRDIVSIEKDGVLAPPLFAPTSLEPGHCAITFDGLLANRRFVEMARRVLKKCEAAYGMPVDMEFCYHNGKLYILQCRHLSERPGAARVTLPAVPEQDILFTARRNFTSAIVADIDTVVWVDGEAYDALASAEEKLEVARVVGRVNRALQGRRFILMGPGRWGTTNASLGVRVQYSEINNALMLIEVARRKGGVTPELSHGTHFFQDLVEANIVPLPLYPDDDGVVFRSEFFAQADNDLAAVAPECAKFKSVVSVIHVPKACRGRKLQVYLDDREPRGVGFIG